MAKVLIAGDKICDSTPAIAELLLTEDNFEVLSVRTIPVSKDYYNTEVSYRVKVKTKNDEYVWENKVQQVKRYPIKDALRMAGARFNFDGTLFTPIVGDELEVLAYLSKFIKFDDKEVVFHVVNENTSTLSINAISTSFTGSVILSNRSDYDLPVDRVVYNGDLLEREPGSELIVDETVKLTSEEW